MAEERDPLDRLLLQARQRQLSEDECNQIRGMVPSGARDQPLPFAGKPPDPRRFSPTESLIKPGATARQQANAEDDQDPDWVTDILDTIKPHVPDHVHAGARARLLRMHDLGYRPSSEEGRLRERGELVQEGPNGMPEPIAAAMDRMLPRRLFGFDTSTFGPRH